MKNPTIFCLLILLASCKSMEVCDYWSAIPPEPEYDPLHVLPLDLNTGEIHFEYTKSMNDVERDELYKRARIWFARNYKDSRSVLEVDDRQIGLLVGNGISSGVLAASAWMPQAYSIRHRIEVHIKDNKYKLVLDILDLEYDDGDGLTEWTERGFIMCRGGVPSVYQKALYKDLLSEMRLIVFGFDKAVSTSERF